MGGPDSPVRRTVLEGHDGTVARFVGDAVRAVFGFPLAHEGRRAPGCAGASEMRLTLAALNLDLKRDYGAELELRTGISSREVVAGAGGR